MGNNNTACKLMSRQLFRAKRCSPAPGKHNSFIFQTSAASQLLRTFPPDAGTFDRCSRAALGCQPCPRVTCASGMDGSASPFGFCLASGNFFCYPSCPFYPATSISQYFKGLETYLERIWNAEDSPQVPRRNSWERRAGSSAGPLQVPLWTSPGEQAPAPPPP